MRMLKTIVVAGAMCFGLGAAHAGHPMTIADLSRLKNLGAPQMSPDGSTIALSVSQFNIETSESRDVIELVDVESGERLELVEGGSPQWSPDGTRLAYLGHHDERNGLWLIEIATERRTFLTEIHSAAHFLGHRSRKNRAWSPDGSMIAYIGAEPPIEEENKSDVKVFTRTLYKTRTGFTDGRNVHVWVVSTSGEEEAYCISPGDHDEHSLSWSPDSSTIAFCSNRSEDPDQNYVDDIFTINLESGERRRITYSLGTESNTSFSPDGKWIAYHGTERPHNTKDSPPEDTQLFIVPSDRSGGATRCLTRDLDRRVGGFLWHPGGSSIYFTAGDRGMRPVFRVDVETAAIDRLIEGPFTVGSFSFDAAGEKMAVQAGGPTHPADLWFANADLSEYRQLGNYHEEFLDAVDLQDIEPFWFDSYDGTPVQGWVMKPAGFETGKSYPTLLSVHGGPHGMFSYSFSTRLQWLAANGYGVVFINPRGSTGYGQAFSDGCVLNWGGGDYQDLMRGLDAAIADNMWIDSQRLGVIGGSYGGFMTNWIVTQTDRFKAAVAAASVSNLISFYGTSLYQLLIEVEFNGMPWDNYDLLWHWSPLKHVKNVVTPTMLVHGEVDHDVPITQAEEMYIALTKLGVETMLVRYPNEGHGFRQPAHQVDYMQRVIKWFDGYLK